MNHSISSADRATHLKVVVVALLASVVVAGVGIYSRVSAGDYTQTAGIVRAGQPMALTNSDTSMVR
ncbi:MAG: hypothetical protein ACRECL_08305 [Bradyrhizobium sp.]